MTQMVRKADVERMLQEAFIQGADDFNLIPNLICSMQMFMPTFDLPLTGEHVRTAEAVAQANLTKHRGYCK